MKIYVTFTKSIITRILQSFGFLGKLELQFGT